MKLLALLCLMAIAMIAYTIADITLCERLLSDEDVEQCYENANLTEDELNLVRERMMEIIEADDIDEETKKSFLIFSRCVTCMLEKKDLIKDEKLVVDKIIKQAEKKDKLLNKKDLEECLNSLNEDDLNQEQRAFGLALCFYLSSPESNKK